MRNAFKSALVVLALAGTTPAFAHSVLVRSSPSDKAVLTQAPSEIRLTFNERIEPRFSTIELSVDGSKVKAERPDVEKNNPYDLVLRPPPLKPGRYLVKWRAISADSHKIEGTFGFQVGP
jgi:copper resistance protein C